MWREEYKGTGILTVSEGRLDSREKGGVAMVIEEELGKDEGREFWDI